VGKIIIWSQNGLHLSFGASSGPKGKTWSPMSYYSEKNRGPSVIACLLIEAVNEIRKAAKTTNSLNAVEKLIARNAIPMIDDYKLRFDC
jgi:hypothetical protein